MAKAQSSPRREEILVLAAGLFAHHGYHGTSIRDVAKAADVQSATLYGHFPSKAAMFHELLDRFISDLAQSLGNVATGPGTAQERLVEMIRAAVDSSGRHQQTFIALLNSWMTIKSTPGLSDLEPRVEAVAGLWFTVIDAAVSEGSLPADTDRSEVLWLLYACVTGMTDQRYLDISREPFEPPVRLLLKVLEQGLWVAPVPKRRERPPLT